MLCRSGLLFFWIGFCLSSFSCFKPKNSKPGGLKDTVLYNEIYGPHDRHRFDIHLPANRDTSTPVVVLLHGGGWKYGNKEDIAMLVDLVKTHWKEAAVVNANYRLASNADGIHHEEIMDDLTALMQHLLIHRQTYRIGRHVALAGESAGAHLAMIYAYRYNPFHNIRCVGDIYGPAVLNDWSWYSSANLWLGTQVGNILSEYIGQPWDSATYAAASPYWQATGHSPPTVIFHGFLDPIVPKYQSDWLNGRMQSLGVPRQYHELWIFHGLNYYQAADVAQKMTAFFRQWF
jgi:acetyl esterase/lipase